MVPENPPSPLHDKGFTYVPLYSLYKIEKVTTKGQNWIRPHKMLISEKTKEAFFIISTEMDSPLNAY